jgi:hypothetical protein
LTPEIGNFRGGMLASLTSAPIALVTECLAAAVAVGVVAATSRPLRARALGIRSANERAIPMTFRCG